jgi:hypothetical protein
VRVVARAMALRTCRRLRARASSGNVRSIAMISACISFSVASTAARANSRNHRRLKPVLSFAMRMSNPKRVSDGRDFYQSGQIFARPVKWPFRHE